jgi:hypothetical protein
MRPLLAALALTLLLPLGLSAPRAVDAQLARAAADPAADAAGLVRLDQIGGSGEALVSAGDTLYAAFGPRLLRLDEPDASGVRQVGARSEILDGAVRGLARSGGLLYATTNPGGLLVLEDRGSELAIVGQLDVPVPGPLAVAGEILLITDFGISFRERRPGGIDVVDLRDPLSPASPGSPSASATAHRRFRTHRSGLSERCPPTGTIRPRPA